MHVVWLPQATPRGSAGLGSAYLHLGWQCVALLRERVVPAFVLLTTQWVKCSTVWSLDALR